MLEPRFQSEKMESWITRECDCSKTGETKDSHLSRR